MEKEWLIRTQHNQILGPVSKDKIKHLINENTLTSEDELCCGNGFWFKVKEKELVEKYVFGDFIQGFNPIGEAEDVLTAPEKDSSTKVSLIPIFLFILSTFFINLPSADAQAHFGEMFKKKNLQEPSPLNLKKGIIYPQLDLAGFYFEKIDVQLPEECSGIDFDLKILILLIKRDGGNQDIDQFITKCRNHFSDEFLFQLSQVNNKKESLEKILNRVATKPEKEKIQEIFLTNGFKNPQKELLDFFIQKMNEKDNIKKSAITLKTIQKQREGLFKYLLELSVALDSDNQAWSKKISKKIINMEPQELLFQRVIDSGELKKQVRDVIQVFITKFKSKFKNEMLKKMLLDQLSNLYPSENFENGDSFWSNGWTLSEMRNFLGSRNYGRPFIGFWFLELISATHEAEVMQFLKEVLDKESVSKNGRSFPWIFTFYPSENFRPEVIAIFKDLWNTGNSYQRFLVLESLENPGIKEAMSKEIPELSKPNFQIKRTLFLNMLKKGENLYFSIYQLLKLGDRSEELLWWVTFFEK